MATAPAIFGRFLAIFLEIDTYHLFYTLLLSSVMGKPIFRPIGHKMAILSNKNLYFGHFWPLSQNVHIPKRAPRKSYLLLRFNRYIIVHMGTLAIQYTDYLV